MKFNLRNAAVWVVLVCLTLAIGGCSQNPVDLVKTGVLKMDESVTVGDAFNGYHYFDVSDWQTFQDSQNRQVVQFNASFNYDKFADSEFEGIKLTAERLKEGKAKMGDITMTYTAQFSISKDGETFSLSYSGFHMSGTNAQTGEKVEFDLPDEEYYALQCIYGNKPVPQVWGMLAG
ncbi:hypothetical protein Dalk_4802 [Desulfatibacillum aliphaticivorans]|uniref:Lipoprotein n=1 Tax=Desulfatibacillum aliphaticivorans TaxID=218208 RepID=B8FD48_DESAL|nr:hypothetical protein [Desulfatibacillum aliphaticivorans]ACL06479.1 hypothetical protein Dalk_4802 [Desulfatibacillum aliphaticivorans]